MGKCGQLEKTAVRIDNERRMVHGALQPIVAKLQDCEMVLYFDRDDCRGFICCKKCKKMSKNS